MLWLMAVAWAGSTPADIPNPRARNAWVSDVAGVIDASEETAMNSRIEQLYAAHGVEIAVVTVTDVVGTPKDFTTKLFNLWGVGDAKTDSGLLIVLVMQQRRLEMETGYGLEGTLSDGWLGTMQSSVMVPHFKRGEHGKGLAAGLAAVEAKLSGSGDLGSSSPGTPSRPDSSVGPVPIIGGALAFLCTFGAFGAMVLGVVLFIRWRRRKERMCPQCQIETELLAESDEDAYLDEGQEAEEDTGAVQWDVRLCPGCRDVRVIDKTPWYRTTVQCPGCGYRTGKVKRRVIKAATYTSMGMGSITRTCSHCSHHTQRNYHISKKTRSSSSGSFGSGGGGFSSGGGGFSGGGSFGGGSSGGGGAGSSW